MLLMILLLMLPPLLPLPLLPPGVGAPRVALEQLLVQHLRGGAVANLHSEQTRRLPPTRAVEARELGVDLRRRPAAITNSHSHRQRRRRRRHRLQQQRERPGERVALEVVDQRVEAQLVGAEGAQRGGVEHAEAEVHGASVVGGRPPRQLLVAGGTTALADERDQRRLRRGSWRCKCRCD